MYTDTRFTRRKFNLTLCGAPFVWFSAAAEEFSSMPWNAPATVAKRRA